MNDLISSENRNALKGMLSALGETTAPLWGKMLPQQMVEHLVESVEYSNGKKATLCERSPAEAEAQKQIWVHTDAVIPKNLILGDLPVQYQFDSLQKAIEQLLTELDHFDRYYNQPGIIAVHPGFGDMNHNEWLLWHSKHFIHHFKQFGLL